MSHIPTIESARPGLLARLPLEIWTLVAEQIHEKRTFMQLIQVCRSFHEIFLPFLHRNLSLLLSRKPPDSWNDWAVPAYLKHVRGFEVVLHDFSEKYFVYFGDWLNKAYGRFLGNILKHMPNLQSFRWKNLSCQEDFEPALILRQKSLLASLKKCKRLKHLSLVFGSAYIASETEARNLWTELKGFQNLTSLELYHFFGVDSKLIRDIAVLLSKCPHLKCLGLGKAHDANCDGSPEVIITNGKYRFFEKLCKRYASHQGTSPMGLETLKLGHGMFIKPARTPGTGNYLEKLVQLRELKTLHIFNSLTMDDEEASIEQTSIDWTLFADCRSLRQLSVSRLTCDVAAWLKQGGNTVQELFVTDHYSMYENALNRFNDLALSGLSMLWVKEVLAERRDTNASEDWEDTDSNISALEPEEDEDISRDIDLQSEEVIDRPVTVDSLN